MRHQLDDLTDDVEELREFERIADVLAAGPLSATDDPPADLWDRIAAAVDADSTRTGAGASTPATVTSLADRRGTDDDRRRTARAGRLVLAAAAAVLVVVALGAVLFQRASGGGTELVASSDLALLAGGGSARAELVRSDDDTVLRVDLSGLTPAERSDFFELWLLDPANGNPQPLAKFEQSDGVVEVVLPPGLSTSEFPVVDISEELDDGDASHSGKSILRGELA